MYRVTLYRVEEPILIIQAPFWGFPKIGDLI